MRKSLREELAPLFFFFMVAITVLVIDQFAKQSAWRHIPVQPAGLSVCTDEYYLVTVIPHILGFIHPNELSTPYTIFNGFPEYVTAVLCMLALGLLVWMAASSKQTIQSGLALGLVLGGLVGSISDRFWNCLQPADFIQILINWNRNFTPTFNLADVAICVGTGWFLAKVYETKRKTVPSRTGVSHLSSVRVAVAE